METLTKEFFIEKIDSLRTEMATKADLKREISSVREDIESLAEMTSRAFTTVNLDFVRLETHVRSFDMKVDDFVSIDYRGQIDVLRDDMRVIKTRLKIA